jgi:hypothetical protein
VVYLSFYRNKLARKDKLCLFGKVVLYFFYFLVYKSSMLAAELISNLLNSVHSH